MSACHGAPGWRCEQGAIGLVTTLCTLLLAGVVLLTLHPLAAALLVSQRAGGVADLVALAVLAGSPLAGGAGEPAIQAGQQVAAANGARLVALDVAAWPTGIHVEVDLPVRISWLPDPRVSATGAARLSPP